MQTKRFVIRKSLVGKNVTITFTNKKGETFKYNHDEVYNVNKDKLENMECFKKYKSYTATNNVPSFAKELLITEYLLAKPKADLLRYDMDNTNDRNNKNINY